MDASLSLKRIGAAFALSASLVCLLIANSSCSSQGGVDALRSGDYAEALRLLEPLAENGDAMAQYHLGVMHADGLGVVGDDVQAARYFRRAAEQENVKALYSLGAMYDTGRGVPQDYGEAFTWYHRAAERGDARAQYKLGLIYDTESGVARDYAKAVKWYRRAAEQGHGGAQHALLSISKSVRVTDILPAFAVSRAAKPIVPELDLLDQKAHDKQLQLFHEFFETNGEVTEQASGSYVEAERTLNVARNEAWKAIPLTRDVPVLVAEPLRLAMLELHIELRRRLGPIHHTLVPSLASDPGCTGDFVADRLVFVYGAANTEAGLVRAANSDAVPGHLGEMARQVACLRVEQLSRLEAAVSNGFDSITNRMKEEGLGDLIPAFARLTAPIQVLILDARKHHGEQSLAWRWFRTYGQMLKEEVARAGWASNGALYLWSRARATMATFPRCPQGRFGPDCVDFTTFSESLMDPRSIGLGNCALAGMIAYGQDSIGGEDRYTCPSLPCREDPNVGPTDEEIEPLKTMLAERWPSAPLDELLPLEGGVTDRLCRHLDNTLLQGALPAATCVDEIFGQAENPWDTYAGCMVDLAGGEPEIFARLPGVPMGPGCGLVGEEPGGGAPSPPETPTPPTPPTPGGGAPPPAEAAPPAEEVSGPGEIVKRIEEKGYTITTYQNGTSIIVINPEDMETYDEAVGVYSQAWVDSEGNLTNSERRQVVNRLFEWMHKNFPNRSCDDPANCPDACTGLGAQVVQAQLCTENLLNAFREALGRPSQGPTEGQQFVDPRTIIYSPEDAPVDDSGVCVEGDTGPRGFAFECGIFLCPGTAGHVAESEVGGTCGCGPDLPAFVPIHPRCYAITPDPDGDQPLNADCSGGLPREVEPLPTPPGGPADRTRP